MNIAPVAPGLLAVMPMTAAKLEPTLLAAERAGVGEVVCVDDGLDASAIAQKVLKGGVLRVSGHPTFDFAAASPLPELLSRNPWGVFPAHEAAVEPAAVLAHTLQSSGLLVTARAAHSSHAAKILRYKDLFRRHVDECAALQTPEILPVWHRTFSVSKLSVKNLLEAGAPDWVVVKPRNASGSKGVELIHLKSNGAEEQLQAVAKELLYLRANPASREIDVGMVEVEAFVVGEEFSVEGFVQSGEVYVGAIHWKPDMYKDWNNSGEFLEGRFVTLPASVSEYSKLSRINAAVLASIPGLGDTPFHAEYRIDPVTGRIYPIEIAGRIGGGHLAESAAIFSGIDLYDAGVRLAMGLSVSRPVGPMGLASEGVIFPENDGTLARFYLQLPGEEPLDATAEREAELREHINQWLARVPRAAARSLYENFSNEVPFHSPLRRDLQDRFSTEGVGLDAVVKQLHIWGNPGDSIVGSEGVYLGGLLLSSRSDASDLATLADLNAAMGLVLAAFHSEVRPV
ncbi:MAG: ATP-grasp domain-containing protein [Deltaproteobacteria bacterium]|nr:ATP-grasp domain-containing protein [Deltaproteobacteria bacterium]